MAARSMWRGVRRGRRSRLGCALPLTAVSRSNWSRARTACRPVKPARSTILPKGRRVCSAAASSPARSLHRPPSARLPPTSPQRIDRAARARGEDAMASELDKDAVTKAYARWAPIYDVVFGAVFDRGRKASIAAAERVGGRILEVGVGPGLSLPDYARTNRLIGVDLSAPMLQKAKERAATHRLSNVDGLAVMDAQHLGFQDGVFDVVVAQYVITAVPDPEATLDEFARVLKPGGEIILVNHLGAETGLRATLEGWFAPLANRLGWRPEFPWDRLAQWAVRHGGGRAIARRPMPPVGPFSLISVAPGYGAL